MSKLKTFNDFINEAKEERCFSGSSYNEEGRPKYATNDPLSMDLSDILNFLFSFPRPEMPPKAKWNSMFDTFKEFWTLDVENPYSDNSSILRFMKNSTNEFAEFDGEIISKEELENAWADALNKKD